MNQPEQTPRTAPRARPHVVEVDISTNGNIRALPRDTSSERPSSYGNQMAAKLRAALQEAYAQSDQDKRAETTATAPRAQSTTSSSEAYAQAVARQRAAAELRSFDTSPASTQNTAYSSSSQRPAQPSEAVRLVSAPAGEPSTTAQAPQSAEKKLKIKHPPTVAQVVRDFVMERIYYECRDLATADTPDVQDVTRAELAESEEVWVITGSWSGAKHLYRSDSFLAAQAAARDILRKRSRARGRATCRMSAEIIVEYPV